MLVIAPIIVPNIVIAVAIYFAYIDARLIGSLPGFVMAHAIICIPFVVLTVTASLQRFDAGLELAAMSCGASRFRAFFLVTLPNIWPGVAAGGVFSFITSFDEPVISYFISSIRQATLPRVMFQNIETQVKPDVAAIGALMIVASVAAVLVYLVKTRPKAADGRHP
jgi:mannopine transport system permease protein